MGPADSLEPPTGFIVVDDIQREGEDPKRPLRCSRKVPDDFSACYPFSFMLSLLAVSYLPICPRNTFAER